MQNQKTNQNKMESIIKALSTNFDLLDFVFCHYEIQRQKDENFLFDFEYIEKNKDNVDWGIISSYAPFSEKEIDLYFDMLKGIESNNNIHWNKSIIDKYANEFDWYILCYNYSIPWNEDLIDNHYDRINWFGISDNPKIKWDERLLNKYWDKILLNCIISHSLMYWDEKLVRFVLSKHDKESTKIFWLEKFSVITNIQWNLKMIIDFPTSYWIREVVEAKTLEFSFEDLKKYKVQLNKDIFKYFQVSSDLFWTYQTIHEFKELINFKILSKSKNVDWSNEIISNFENNLDFNELSKNLSIPLDDTIIKKYEIRWDFDSLSSHPGVKWNLGLIKSFINKFDLNKVLQFFIVGVNEDFIHEYRDYIKWESSSGQFHDFYDAVPISGFNHIPISVQTLIEKATEWKSGAAIKPYWSEKGYALPGEWHLFSGNKFLNEQHLEAFSENLSWDIISSNEFLTITNELLLKFSDKWNWSKVLNRNDFKLEHFYAIHQYLNLEILSANSVKIIELLKPEEDTIFNHLKNGKFFMHSLRSLYEYRRENKEYEDSKGKLLHKTKRAFQAEQCEKATFNLKEINNRDKKDVAYFDEIYYWLRKYFKLFDEITYVSDSLERERVPGAGIDFYEFFVLYCEYEEIFKKNYFDVFK